MMTRVLLAFVPFAALLSQTVAAGSQSQVVELPMQGYAGHFHERCMELQGGQTLRVSVHSPHPVRFNVHYHADGKTRFLLDEIIENAARSAVGVPADGEYCLEVRNPVNRPSAFELRLEYQVLPD